MKMKDLKSKKFGRWTVLGLYKLNKWNRPMWACRCDCGVEKLVSANSLLMETSTSCGCFHRENFVKRITKHGLMGSLTRASWKNMKSRCHDPRHKRFPHYGGRGIIPCAGINDSPQKLIDAIGERPSRKHSIDRIDNDKGYHCGSCPECLMNGFKLNVKWSTNAEQCHNTSRTVMVKMGDETKCLTDWVREKKAPYSSFRDSFMATMLASRNHFKKIPHQKRVPNFAMGSGWYL